MKQFLKHFGIGHEERRIARDKTHNHVAGFPKRVVATASVNRYVRVNERKVHALIAGDPVNDLTVSSESPCRGRLRRLSRPNPLRPACAPRGDYLERPYQSGPSLLASPERRTSWPARPAVLCAGRPGGFRNAQMPLEVSSVQKVYVQSCTYVKSRSRGFHERDPSPSAEPPRTGARRCLSEAPPREP